MPPPVGPVSASRRCSTRSFLRCRVVAEGCSWGPALVQSEVGELHSLTDWQVSEASEDAELEDFWLVMSEGMGEGGLE